MMKVISETISRECTVQSLARETGRVEVTIDDMYEGGTASNVLDIEEAQKLYFFLQDHIKDYYK